MLHKLKLIMTSMENDDFKRKLSKKKKKKKKNA